MKRLAGLLIALLLAAALTYAAGSAPSAGFRLDRGLFSSAGGASMGGEYSLQGSFGQPFVGYASGGPYQLHAGFLLPVDRQNSLYLPLVRQ